MSKADTTTFTKKEMVLFNEIQTLSSHFSTETTGKTKSEDVNIATRFKLRKDIIKITKNSDKLITGKNLSLSKNDMLSLKEEIKSSKKLVEYAPSWVIIMISISLGLGTMIGWKRIVKTIGEKIGKQHMSYAQGASAELVASIGIGVATRFGVPVSTTHMLSSGIMGSMVAKKGLKNLQKGTVINIALAWVLTLPVTIVLSGGLFLLFRAIL
jgi:PiT family inorganic phosphate transporter